MIHVMTFFLWHNNAFIRQYLPKTANSLCWPQIPFCDALKVFFPFRSTYSFICLSCYVSSDIFFVFEKENSCLCLLSVFNYQFTETVYVFNGLSFIEQLSLSPFSGFFCLSVYPAKNLFHFPFDMLFLSFYRIIANQESGLVDGFCFLPQYLVSLIYS